MIVFELVPLHEIYEEIQPNIPRHYAEMTEGDEYGIPDIDWDSYLAASRAGYCRVVTVRDKGKLVGYSVYSIGLNPRYKTRLEASSDGIFLEKEYRGIVSGELLKKADEFLENLGVRETNYILSDDRVGRVLGTKGYKAKYKIWSKTYGQ